VRFEHGCAQGRAAFIGDRARRSDHRLMAAMHAVEIAERNRRAARIVRNFGGGLAHSFTKSCSDNSIAAASVSNP
jgi:hypothetical protein